MSRSTIDWQKHWIDESERLEGLCEVSMWTRPLDSSKKAIKLVTGNSLLSSISGSSVAFSKYIASLAGLSHWALIFHWTQKVDDRGVNVFPKIACYEGFEDEGKLVPYWSQNEPDGNDWKKTSIGEIEISPQRVNQLAKDLWCNNSVYNEVLQNCQLWANALWKKIKGEEIPVIGLADSHPMLHHPLVQQTLVQARRTYEICAKEMKF